MKTCEYIGEPFDEPRSHPWSTSMGDAACRYYDLGIAPAHIRTSLEDFVPWNHYPAVEVFYTLLERINHASSALESNDSAFIGPRENERDASEKAFECSGRVMLLFRALGRNLPASGIAGLAHALHMRLSVIDPTFLWGVIGTTIVPVRYLAFAEGDQLGSQLMLSFWAWGDDEAETMENLGRLMQNLSEALREAPPPDYLSTT